MILSNFLFVNVDKSYTVEYKELGHFQNVPPSLEVVFYLSVNLKSPALTSESLSMTK
jgi:hypothetical protein